MPFIWFGLGVVVGIALSYGVLSVWLRFMEEEWHAQRGVYWP